MNLTRLLTRDASPAAALPPAGAAAPGALPAGLHVGHREQPGLMPEAYHPEEIMLLEPSALVRAYGFWDEPEPFERVGQAAVVTIEGPLLRKGGWYYDGYDKVLDRFTKAHGSDARSVVIRAHSPGGYLSGCFDTVRAMRAVKKASGKKTILVADQAAYSAMYALATAADEIHCPLSAGVGSIGVISYRIDWSKMNEQMGLLVVAFASGKQKTDGDPDTPLTDEERARHQERVMLYAGQFWELVAEARPLTVAQIRAQEAGTFVGEQAVKAGLADGVKTFAEVIADLEKTSVPVRGGVGRQARGEKKTMEITAYAVVLGLSADATEQQCADKLAALAKLEKDILDKTGEASAKDALVRIHAWQDGAEKATTALEQLEASKKEVERLTALEDERAWNAKLNEGKQKGAITPANEAKIMADYKGDLAGLTKFVANAVCAVPGSGNKDSLREAANEKKGEPKTEDGVGTNDQGVPTWHGKTWAELKPIERATLHNTNLDHYRAMKASAEK